MSHTYLRFPPNPSLPISPKDWDAGYHDQYSNVLRLYFNQLSNGLQQLTNTRGGYRLSFPHGSFYDVGDQNIASTSTAYPIRLNSTAMSSGVSVVDNSKITVEQVGIYNLQFSVQLNNANNAPQDADIWLRKNGVDVPHSNSRFGMPARKSAGNPFHSIGALNLFVEMSSTDYVQLMWCATSTDVSLAEYPAPTGPVRPEIPSAIVTMSFVSAPLG
jgi:hypothetical protein